MVLSTPYSCANWNMRGMLDGFLQLLDNQAFQGLYRARMELRYQHMLAFSCQSAVAFLSTPYGIWYLEVFVHVF